MWVGAEEAVQRLPSRERRRPRRLPVAILQILNKVCPICFAYCFHDLCAAETAALPGGQPLDSL
jgi:hypothetical protein